MTLKVPAHDEKATWNTHEIPSDYWDGRFFVNLKDLAPYLKSPVGRLGYNMYAPLNQVVTCLGWTPAYDRSKLQDPKDPLMVVQCMPPHSGGAVAPRPAAQAAVKGEPGEIKIVPMAGIPAMLFGQKVGAKKTVTFNCPLEPAAIEKAWLELEADDIDEPKEAKIVMNGKTMIAVTKEVLIPQGSVWGRLVVPAKAIVKGTNTFEFTFADNLGGVTGGYDVLHAALVVKLR